MTTDGSGPSRFPAWVRARYTAALDAALPPPHAAVLLGVVLGIRQGIPPALQNALIATGLVHLLVLSGLKVAVFARIVQGFLRPVLGQLAAWPALALIAVYAMVGGATPAAVRAAAMGGLAIAAARLGRPTHVWTSLALTAAAMLGWHPELAWDVGFQLSFAGTAAIILMTPSIERRLTFMPRVLREPFAVTCAAQVGTLPMMATDFHVLSPVAPLANALVIPILPALISAGLALGVLAAVPELARIASIPIAGLLAFLEQVAYVLARVPVAAIPIPRFPTWAGLAYYSALAPGIAAEELSGRRRAAAIITALVAPAVIATLALGMWANAPPQAIVMAVGDGQAVLLKSPRGAIL
ncbi:MAG TPA: ComEC/Rec2 family competence protein, partial [Steroidobacteraceae bacterium]